MNLQKDIKDEIDREVYLKRIEFAETLVSDIPYREKLSLLIKLSTEITILASTYKTFEALFNKEETN
jgi:hypothetical protein